MIVITFLFLALTVNAQFTVNGVRTATGNDVSYTYEGVADSVDTLGYGKAFSLAGYNATLATYAPVYTKILTSVLGTPYVDVILFGSYDGETWFSCDTIMYKDSVETRSFGTVDFNGKPVSYVKPYIYGTKNGANTNNRSDSEFKFTIQLYKPD